MTAPAGPDGRPTPAALLVDLYQLTMAESYFAEGMHERPATFSLFTRRLPESWGYLVAAGLDDALRYLESLAFADDELVYLEETRLFTPAFLSFLAGLRFTGDVRAMPEGTLFFPHEPVLEVTAPVLQAQLVETIVLQEIHFQSLVAGKAARCVDVGRGSTLVEFGLRRTHRADAGLRAARSAYLAGFASTSNVLAGKAYGIPIAGTMAHSYVEAFEDELAAFRAFARSFPDRVILLVDTYDTVAGARRAAAVGRELDESGHRLLGVRLDSGDLVELSRTVRTILDEEGFPDAIVFASGGLDEHDVAELLGAAAPIAGFGIGSKLGTAADSPFLDMAYKLVEFDGRPTLKLSATKATLPGRKQAWRLTADGSYALDVLGLADQEPPEGGEPLLVPAMKGGRRVTSESLAAARRRCAAQRSLLPSRHRALSAEPYEVELAAPLAELRDRVAADARRRHGLAPSTRGS
jgi:nicotinate phosphoribosyltransferase